MFEIIFISCVVALFLLVWFHSEAFIEYATLFSGARFFHIESYKEEQKTRATLTYHGHLLEKRDSFFIRLITCPLCLSFWTTLITSLLVTEALWVFPICNILSLTIYALIVKLLDL